MVLHKTIKNSLSVIGLSLISSFTHAVTINIDGEILATTGAIGSLVALETPFTGSLEWNGQLGATEMILSNFCFTTNATGMVPTSPGCGSLSAVPILPTGQTYYDGTTNAPGTTYEQAGTTFDGNNGLLKITSFAPTAQMSFFIDLAFNGDGTGNLYLDTGSLGGATGTFTYSAVPVPAAAWLFGSSLLGLAATARKRKTA